MLKGHLLLIFARSLLGAMSFPGLVCCSLGGYLYGGFVSCQ